MFRYAWPRFVAAIARYPSSSAVRHLHRPSQEQAMLTESELSEFRSAVRRFVDEEITPRFFEHETNETFPHDVLKMIRENGYTGLRLPVAHGGQAISFREYCVVLEEFGRNGPALYLWINDGVRSEELRVGKWCGSKVEC